MISLYHKGSFLQHSGSRNLWAVRDSVESVKAGLRNARAKGTRLGRAARVGFGNQDSRTALRRPDPARDRQPLPSVQDHLDQSAQSVIAALLEEFLPAAIARSSPAP